ncbi:MAG: glycosyltransferase family 39 protein, partial [Bacteroidia bacterium]
MSWVKNNWLILLVLAIGFLLRFVPLFEYEYFYDELTAIDRIRYTNLSDIINNGVVPDVHPAFIQVFLYYWAKIGGTSEVWIKLPFLACGFLSCWFLFLFSKKWFGYKTGVIAAIVISCSMIFLVYSSSNHLYATAVLFSVLATYYLFEITFGNSIQLKHYILFGLFVLLGALNHHMGALYGLIIGALGVVFSQKKQRNFLLLSAIVILLFYAPNLSITLKQMSYSIGPDQGGWLTAPKWYACFSFLKTLFGTGWVIYFFISLFLFSSIKNRFGFIKDKKIIFLFTTFLTYCLIVHFYSILKSPILQFSVLLIAAPCIIIVMAKGLSLIPDKFFNTVSIILIIVFLIQTIYVKQYYSLGIKQGNRSAVVQTIEAKNKYGTDKVTAIYATEAFFVTHYMDEFKNHFTYLTSADSIYNNQVLLGRYLKSLKENYILLSDPDAILLERTKIYFPYLIYHDEGYFKDIFLLSKTNTNSIKDETILGEFKPDRSSTSFNFPEKYATENNNILIDSTNEFPFYVWADFNSLHFTLGQVVICSSVFKPQNEMRNLTFDFNIKKNDSSLFYANRNFKDFYLS